MAGPARRNPLRVKIEMDQTPVSESSILRPGETCWRRVRAPRAKLLIEGASYYATLREVLLAARNSVHIVGWDIDSRVDLKPDGADDGKPTRLRELLCHMVEERPGLRINLLLWDYSTLYALGREPLPRISLGWQTPEQVRICLDDVLPLGACHHQKLVVVDDSLAFCGGLDLTARRWDTREHSPTNPDRRDPDGRPYEAFHDMQFMVDGEAAAALAELAHKRWNEASCERLEPVRPAGDLWPDRIEPDFTDIEIGIARTQPEMQERPEAREIESMYLQAIKSAERLIYLENQYLTNDALVDTLSQRLCEKPDLEAVLVGPQTPHGWIEAKTMGVGRLRFLQRLEEAGVADRVRLVSPVVTDDEGDRIDVMVHAKAMFVDDRFMTVGSANLNNRSLGFDSECNLAIEAEDDELRGRISALRNGLLGEHLGMETGEVGRRLDDGAGSALALVDGSAEAPRRLEPIDDSEWIDDIVASTVTPLADPERPLDPGQMVLDLFGGVATGEVRPWIHKVGMAAAVLLALVAAWRWTPLSRYTDIDVLQPIFDNIAASPYAPLAMLAIFVVGGVVFFPVTVLITLTAIAFETPAALAYSLGGALTSAAAAYLLGLRLGRPVLRQMIGKRLNQVARAIGKRGIIAVMTLRVAPVAPFTAINLVCGAVRIRFLDYMAGSFLGMAPGIVVLTILGDRLRRIIAEPTPATIATVVAVIVVWILLGIGFQKLLDMLRQRNTGGKDR